MQKKGLALSALIVGIGAFLIGWTPVIGLLVGGAAIVLGAVAIAKNQPRGLSVTGIILGALALLTSIVMTIAVAVAGPATDTDAQMRPAPTKEEVDVEEPEEVEEIEETDESPTQVVIPELQGQPASDADDALQELGFATEFDAGEETVLMRSNWVVTATTPAAGESLEQGSPVTLHVEKKDIEVEATSTGLTGTYAWAACANAGEELFPYGFRFHLTGIMADEPREDEWFLKATITTENEFGNKRKDQVMECYVTGTNDAPTVSDFLVY